jgi:hypothetical protein
MVEALSPSLVTYHVLTEFDGSLFSSSIEFRRLFFQLLSVMSGTLIRVAMQPVTRLTLGWQRQYTSRLYDRAGTVLDESLKFSTIPENIKEHF